MNGNLFDDIDLPVSNSIKNIAEKPTTKISVVEFPDFNNQFSTDKLLAHISARTAAMGKKISKSNIANVIGLTATENVSSNQEDGFQSSQEHPEQEVVEENEDDEIYHEPEDFWAKFNQEEEERNKKEILTFDGFFNQEATQQLIEQQSNAQDKWGGLLDRFKPHFSVKFYQALLGSAIISSQSDVVTIGLDSEDFLEIKHNRREAKLLQDLMRQVSKRNIQLKVQNLEETPSKSPKILRQQAFEMKRDEVWSDIENSEQFKAMREAFGVELVRDSRYFALPQN